MLLKPATDAELADLVLFVNAAYRGDSARAGWTSEADLVEAPRVDVATLRTALAENPQARLLIVRDDAGQILACVALEPDADRVWHLGMLTVRPDTQNRKIGRDLLAGAEALAKDHGARGIQMKVIAVRESLIAWYQRRGYRPTGQRLPFLYGDGPRPDLEFLVLEKAF